MNDTFEVWFERRTYGMATVYADSAQEAYDQANDLDPDLIEWEPEHVTEIAHVIAADGYGEFFPEDFVDVL